MDFPTRDIFPFRLDIQLGKDWYCCLENCKSYNAADAKKCGECQHEKCAQCQGPTYGMSQVAYMYICCQCGDGPKLYNMQPTCYVCSHQACSNCPTAQ
ncbi:Zinc finger, RanBP2-type [Penicillium expansum]|uniref:Zinc finger, RanBP2-type n=1 Tax=Penicillium expansum TaxID=27334 RepID=A0A0A2J6B9_PENEN|nr:Zinc finger, RanBP2-type [Penicillium expansum]KGO48821.1 Zinc finger, RanBP2-type [Penicillium expansum]KGO50208.1 Zinc finger, RanBP2-type [Penicillium expansum]KGO61613.1 Zinc finger, RanBP2-type [Penicillium expansum]